MGLHAKLPHAWIQGNAPRSAATLDASRRALEYAHQCRQRGNLITPFEALALACHGAREKETLYSIALKFSSDPEVQMPEVLEDLGRVFRSYV